MQVTAITVYPVKSMQGVSLEHAEIAQTGFQHDRLWMLIDDWGYFLTQRQHPALALIHVAVSNDALAISIPGQSTFLVPVTTRGPVLDATVWGSRCRVIDQGSAASRRIASFLGRSCRLVCMEPGFRREISPSYRAKSDGPIGFPDSMPFLLTSSASLTELNARLPRPVLMNRFRPNIVIDGAAAFEEEQWRRIRIGSTPFRVPKKCLRCEIININQESGAKDIEPLETLEEFRSSAKGVAFGINLIHESLGTIRIGDPVEVIA